LNLKGKCYIENSPEGFAFSDECSVLLEAAVQLVQMTIIIGPAAPEDLTNHYRQQGTVHASYVWPACYYNDIKKIFT